MSHGIIYYKLKMLIVVYMFLWNVLFDVYEGFWSLRIKETVKRMLIIGIWILLDSYFWLGLLLHYKFPIVTLFSNRYTNLSNLLRFSKCSHKSIIWCCIRKLQKGNCQKLHRKTTYEDLLTQIFIMFNIYWIL